MSTLHEKLLAQYGQDRLTANPYSSTPRSVRVGFARNGADELELAGLSYTVDYKTEEEYGVGDLRKAVTSTDKRRFQMTAGAAANIGFFEDVNGLVISSRAYLGLERDLSWGDALSEFGYQTNNSEQDYAWRFRNALSYMQGSKVEHPSRMKIADLRQLAKQFGVEGPLPRSKEALAAHITANVPAEELREHPDLWPAWFSNGQDLVLRADDGPAAMVLEHLREAAKKGTLGIGSASGAFGGSLFLYDTDDETDTLKREREAEFDWYDEHMLPIAAIKANLVADGYSVWFLGNPSDIERDGVRQVRYWLNGSPRHGKQVSGWFTLEELRAQSFAGASV
jgi:hypothetical protein